MVRVVTEMSLSLDSCESGAVSFAQWEDALPLKEQVLSSQLLLKVFLSPKAQMSTVVENV